MPDSSRSGGSGGRSDTADGWSAARRSDEPPRGPGRGGAGTQTTDGWGSPSYSERERPSGNRGNPAGPATRQYERDTRNTGSSRASSDDDGWNRGGPLPARDQRAARAAARRAESDSARAQRSVDKLLTKTSSGREEAARRREIDARRAPEPRPYERGAVWPLALLVPVAITAIGAIIDSVADISGQDGFNYSIVIASIVAILLVKRSHMFPIVVAPPLVYSIAALVQLYIKRSSTSGSSSGLLIDAVQNYLVYGFPALAAATAAALIIAGIRLISRK